MNIASAQKVLQETDTSAQSASMTGISSQAAAALSEAKSSLQEGASSVASSLAPSMGTPTAVNGTASSGNVGGKAARLQLIDEHQKFNAEVGKYLQKWGLEEAGFKYNLCAVVGSQSTGKSTLLNKLFGTTFDVMQENERRQTTKGECRGARRSLYSG